MTIQYKLYLFDFDYTLANSEAGILQCFQTVLKKHGFHSIDDETIKRTIGVTVEEAFVRMTGIQDRDVIAAYRKEYVKKADEVMVPNTKLYPQAIPLLRRLRETGCMTGIVSTKYRYRIEDTFKPYHEENLLDIIIGGEDVITAKPNPEGLLKAIELLGFQKDEVLYIGDNVVDAKAALNAGVDFLGVTTGTTTQMELKEYPNINIVTDLGILKSLL